VAAPETKVPFNQKLMWTGVWQLLSKEQTGCARTLKKLTGRN
jgi:hypothetical protein